MCANDTIDKCMCEKHHRWSSWRVEKRSTYVSRQHGRYEQCAGDGLDDNRKCLNLDDSVIKEKVLCDDEQWLFEQDNDTCDSCALTRRCRHRSSAKGGEGACISSLDTYNTVLMLDHNIVLRRLTVSRSLCYDARNKTGWRSRTQ